MSHIVEKKEVQWKLIVNINMIMDLFLKVLERGVLFGAREGQFQKHLLNIY